jgi:gluconate 2-dehydrogenase gamma chain
MGMADIGYVGNAPNRWTSVPPEVLKQYGLEQARLDVPGTHV